MSAPSLHISAVTLPARLLSADNPGSATSRSPVWTQLYSSSPTVATPAGFKEAGRVVGENTARARENAAAARAI